MPRALVWIIAAVAVLVVTLAGLTAAVWITTQDRPKGALDTATHSHPGAGRRPALLAYLRRRSAANARATVRDAWPSGPHDPLDAWSRELHRVSARLLRGRALCQLVRRTGRNVWQVQTAGKVESSPVVVDGTVYFGSHDGRVFAVRSDTGRILWAYYTGGRVNASPSVFGGRLCVTTYAGSFVCLDRSTGEELWTTYLKRDAFRYESFYASPSTDGVRIYSVARSGKVVALDASSGRVVL